MNDSKRPHIEEKELHLQNSLGRKLTVTLRHGGAGEEEAMIACIRDEYGDTYSKKELYDPAYIREADKGGHLTFMRAETKAGEVAGILILKESAPEENICELASEILRKKYRGYGLAGPFYEYGLNILLCRRYSAALCHPVLFHDITQNQGCRLGLRATGLLLNILDLDKVKHSYFNGKNTKHSIGIQILAVMKMDAGKIYVPHEHQALCGRIYRSLCVDFHMMPDCGEKNIRRQMPPESELLYRQDERQSSLEISIRRIGADLQQRLEEIHGKYRLSGKQTENILLNINDIHAVYVYRSLAKAGYFFTGLKPLCGQYEYMILHHPGDVECFMEDYAVNTEFAKILKYVKRNYERREIKSEEK